MKNNENVLHIPKIELGIVIDHIPAGEGIRILEIISRYEELSNIPVSLGLNYKSEKLGKKDLVKLQIEFLAPEIIQQISIIVPGVTIKAIKNFNVYSKIVVRPPEEIKNLLECKNPNCITNTEKHVGTYFTVVDDDFKNVRCNYCERIFQLHELNPIDKF